MIAPARVPFMALEIHEREREGIVILDLEGRITAGEEAGLLRDTLRRLAEGGHNRIILNLEKVDYIDSTGLGILIGIKRRITERSGCLVLVLYSDRINKLFEITGLSKIFKIARNPEDAKKLLD